MEIIFGNTKLTCEKFNFDEYNIFCDNYIIKSDKIDYLVSDFVPFQMLSLPFTYRHRYVFQTNSKLRILTNSGIVEGTYIGSVFKDEEEGSIAFVILSNNNKYYAVNTLAIIGVGRID